MKKWLFRFCLISGICLILGSLVLMGWNQLRLESGNRQSAQILSVLLEGLPGKTIGVPGLDRDNHKPARQIRGRDYVALLEVPSYGIELPVAANWDADELYICPGRFSGSVYDNSLIIGGTDHNGQLAFCSRIGHGEAITVTDLTGRVFSYRVSAIGRSSSADAVWLTEGEYDLVLFCRDAGTMDYIAVKCVFNAG